MPPPSRQNLPPKHRYDMVNVTPEPPELPVKPKKNPLKSPLKAFKNAIVKGTKTLRRQASFMEPSESKKAKTALRRQQSMMERGSNRIFYSPQHHPSQSQDYYEYQQQQYYNYYYQQQQQQRFHPQDDRYAYYQRHERYYPANGPYQDEEPLYGNYGPRPPSEENIYANRALIELERPVQKPARGIIRRHSMNERKQIPPGFATLTKRRSKYAEDLDDKFAQMVVDEPIYQSQRGSYMYHEQTKPKYQPDPAFVDMKRRQFFERPIEDNEKLMQVRRDVNSPAGSSSSTPTSISSPSKERNLRDSRRQLKEQIYQSRIDAMASMAEPIYVTRSSSGTSTNTGSNLRSQPIYESKKECEDYEADKSKDTSGESNENNESAEKSLLEVIEETIKKNQSQDHLNDVAATPEATENQNQSEIPFADDDTSDSTLQKTAIECATEAPVVKKPSREPYHISSIIKRAAPPPPPVRSPTTAKSADGVFESQVSLDTQFTSSQVSLPVGPPNAQSTPYASELTLKDQRAAAKARFLAAPPLRQPITTKGYFDEQGGILEDKTWNVSLIIPPNALPAGQRQEIYFTVTDPRMSESVGGPPLDMENGWFHTKEDFF
jgi:tight junction protein 1